MSISEEASPPPPSYSSSSSSHDTHNPSLKIYNPSKAKPLEKHHQDAASSSTYIANKSEDHHDRAHVLCKMIRQDLLFMKETIADVKKYVDNMDVQIYEAHEKFEELQATGSSERELEEFKKAIKKLKSKIPSQLKIDPANSKPRLNSWPDINQSSNETSCVEPKSDNTIDPADLLTAFRAMPYWLQDCLLYFFLFPPKAVIKGRVMIYLWAMSASMPVEEGCKEILFQLSRLGFIERIYQKCSLVPDSFRMSLSVRSALSEIAGFAKTSTSNSGQITEFENCLINVNNAIIDRQLFENRTHVSILYLGRWQNSATHHIEVADTKVLYGLKNMKHLRFLSLQGMSLITELPAFISELDSLENLDLKACHNLETLPDGIGSLKGLMHLDMSECYFLEYLPKSLGNLSRLEVLKGFYIGDSKDNKASCTLDDLSRLRRLRKLNIYTSVKDFPTMRHLSALQNFQSLRKLTISWGGCSFLDENYVKPLERLSTIEPGISPPPTLPSRLEKLDLQGFHGPSLPSWLRPANLKKLYIRGGRLSDLHQVQVRNDEESRWTVEILRLKYLSDLKMDWKELMILFPKLIYLRKEDCPQLIGFPCDANGEWIHKKAIDPARALCWETRPHKWRVWD